MTPADVIAEVRQLVQDTRTPYRYTDTVLLGFVNQTIKRMCVLRPDLFTTITTITTTPNTFVQSLPVGAVRLVELFSVANGSALEEVSRDEANRAYPQWTSAPAGTPTKYMRHPRNPTQYFLTPPPLFGVALIGEYVQTPPTYGISATIPNLQDAYLPALVDGTVFLAESIDNEHVNSGRAKLFLDSFIQTLGVSLQSRSVTDSEDGGMASAQRGAA